MDGGEASRARRPERARAAAPTRLSDGSPGMDRRGRAGGTLARGTRRTYRTDCRSLGTHVLGRRPEAVATRGPFTTHGLEKEAETRGGTHERTSSRVREKIGSGEDVRPASGPDGGSGDNAARRRAAVLRTGAVAAIRDGSLGARNREMPRLRPGVRATDEKAGVLYGSLPRDAPAECCLLRWAEIRGDWPSRRSLSALQEEG